MTWMAGARSRRQAVCAAASLLALLSLFGCFGGKRGVPPPTGRETAPSDDAAPSPAVPEIPDVIPLPETETDNVADAPAPSAETGSRATKEEPQDSPPSCSAEVFPAHPADDSADARRAATPAKAPSAEIASSTRQGKAVPPAAPAAREAAPPAAEPSWARKKEELVYRVDFLGITMGYARFRYEGKVSIGGKVAYHLNVRAWTSGVLAFIYPVNETIDYYLDAETLAPLRQEFTQREKKEDDVAIYDQETGTITYRYRVSGEIHKKADVSPLPVYDPVSAAYYFRWRDLGGEEPARNVYAGRKVWQISARVLGNERLQTGRGDVDTLVIQPVIRRNGKQEDKGDLKMWLSNDERRVPVRVYAKFTKIKDWTLVGELMPAQEGG